MVEVGCRVDGAVARWEHAGTAGTGKKGKDLIIRTAAVHNENPEIAAALAAGIPVFERAEAWGSIMRRYENALCISGTHGKTTTTSMCTHIALAARVDPTVMIGGTLPLLGSGYRLGQGDTIILESCEYYNSYHSFSPTIAVILDVDDDHLDFFGNLENVKKSFRTFAEHCIRMRLLSAIRSASRLKHFPLNDGISLEQLSEDPDAEISALPVSDLRSPEELILAKESREELYEACSRCLSRYEIKVLDLYLEGLSYREIADRLCANARSIDNAVQRIRKKVARNKILGDISIS